MDVDRRGRLWVAGGEPQSPESNVVAGYRVYDTRTGKLVRSVTLPEAGFINDVIVTRRAAWFTDSFSPRLIRVPLGRHGRIGEPEFVTLAGDWEQVPDAFNANGIVATRDSRHLIVAQSTASCGCRASARGRASSIR